MKTIVVEALSALQGGGQTYLKNLFEYYPGYSDVRVVAVVPPRFRDFLAANPAIEAIAPMLAADGLPARLLWNRTRLPSLLRELRADVLYCPGGFLARAPIDTPRLPKRPCGRDHCCHERRSQRAAIDPAPDHPPLEVGPHRLSQAGSHSDRRFPLPSLT